MKRVIQCYAAGLAVLCLLSGCGKKDKIESPEAYSIGEDSAISLDTLLDEDKGKLTDISAPESEKEKDDKNKDDKEDKDSEKEKDTAADDVYTYTYGEMAEAPATLQTYAETLIDEENGFSALDEEGKSQEDLPEIGEKGDLVLARASAVEGHIFQLALSWEGEDCTIEVSCPEGAIEEAQSAEQLVTAGTLSGVVDYVSSLSPSELDLPGESMQEYHFYPSEGTRLVDGTVCRQFSVYKPDENTQTNTFVGYYLISAVGRHVYKVDPETKETTQLQ